jgi:hypothetical protein
MECSELLKMLVYLAVCLMLYVIEPRVNFLMNEGN